MDKETAERLNMLQMQDLGTARREYISTTDHRQMANTRVEILEAERKSNIPGSDAQLTAETNRSKLADWANVYKNIGDTDALENLSCLLNGQSHRLRLNEIIRESGGQNYSKSNTGSDNFLKATKTVSFVQEPPARVPEPTERSYKTKKRSTKPSMYELLSNPIRHASNPSPNRTAPKSNLDIKYKAPLAGFGPQKVEGRPQYRENHMHRAVSVKTRRPLLGSFAQILSPPENFLAVARGLVNTKVPGVTNATNISNDNRQEASSKSPRAGDPEDNVHTKIRDAQSKSRSTQSIFPEEPVPNVSSELRQPKIQKHMQYSIPIDKVGASQSADQDLGSEGTGLESSEGKRPRSNSIHSPDRNEHGIKLDQESTPPKQSADRDTKLALKSCPNEDGAILVDLSCTPPRKTRSQTVMSPALEELRGLQFTNSGNFQDPQASSSSISIRKLDFQGHLEEQPKSNDKHISTSVTKPTDKGLASEYQRDIEILCKLMASTTLSEVYLTKLSECKEELETRLQWAQSGQVLDKGVEKGKVFKEKPKPDATNKPFIPETPPNARTVLNITTPSSRARLSAKAPQFVPKSFNEYRSTSESASTDSTATFQETMCKVQSRPASERTSMMSMTDAQTESKALDPLSEDTATSSPATSSPATLEQASAEAPLQSLPEASPTASIMSIVSTPTHVPRAEDTHIIGEHLLPGAKSRSHLFGDHLLPGRRVVQPIATKTNEKLIEQSASNGPDKKSPFPPQSPRAANPNISVFKSANSPNRFTVALNAPQTGVTKQVLSTQTLNVLTASPNVVKGTQNSTIQESIHAPKPIGTQTTPAKRVVTDGLMSSRYATPQKK